VSSHLLVGRQESKEVGMLPCSVQSILRTTPLPRPAMGASGESGTRTRSRTWFTVCNSEFGVWDSK
jgi:hypothetical protein